MDSPFTGSIVLSDATYEEDYITELNVTKSVKQVLNAHKRYSDSSVNTLDTATHTFIQCMSAAWHYTKLTKTTVPLDVKRDWFSQYCEHMCNDLELDSKSIELVNDLTSLMM